MKPTITNPGVSIDAFPSANGGWEVCYRPLAPPSGQGFAEPVYRVEETIEYQGYRNQRILAGDRAVPGLEFAQELLPAHQDGHIQREGRPRELGLHRPNPLVQFFLEGFFRQYNAVPDLRRGHTTAKKIS